MPRPFTVVASDGQPIGGDVWRDDGASRGIVVLLHAMMVDRRSFRGDHGLPGVLAAAGFEVWCADLRGRGASPCVRWNYEDLVRGDIPALIAAARAANRGPVAVVGHSLGAHAALAAAADGHGADAYALLAGNVWMPSLDGSRRRRLAREIAMRGLRDLARGGRFPSRRVRMGPVDECRDYIDDLYRFWRTDRWASRDGFDWRHAVSRVTAPVLAVTGAGDTLMAHPVGARAFANLLPNARFEVVGRENGLEYDPGHMAVTTDLRSRPLWERIARWLSEISKR